MSLRCQSSFEHTVRSDSAAFHRAERIRPVNDRRGIRARYEEPVARQSGGMAEGAQGRLSARASSSRLCPHSSPSFAPWWRRAVNRHGQSRWVIDVLLHDMAGGRQQLVEHSGSRPVLTSVGRRPWRRARKKNRRVTTKSHFSEDQDVDTWPYWSIARYR
jgi:hypothetical protein